MRQAADFPQCLLLKVQDYFEEGYYQLSVLRAIRDRLNNIPSGMNFRQALDQIYLNVRGPALIRLGYDAPRAHTAPLHLPTPHLCTRLIAACHATHSLCVCATGTSRPTRTSTSI